MILQRLSKEKKFHLVILLRWQLGYIPNGRIAVLGLGAYMKIQLLLDAKRRHEGPMVDRVDMWDLPYYMCTLKAQKHQIDARVISAYFPIENCIKGLQLLCSSLFGLE
ncbi:hypothetical protein PsorP6_002631 [Peronosclerospora sorghi]|uniref:Uncharacterized protein n=1 Tax=Peronosclerospora sorghi TaxID=230839 RepID=A0ACC0WRC3_9STRA|nr:hypothetical protein PsorP6_002631 [Peronosclerospora sorghi]